MKIIGKKPSKKVSFGVIRNTVTGRVYGGWNPLLYPKQNLINFPKHKADWTAVRERRLAEGSFKANSSDRWVDTLERFDETYGYIRNCEILEYTPVFEAAMKFTGYSRGRSSVTMDFLHEETGSNLSFGPSGIDAFINAIADGLIKPNVEEGLFPLRFILVKQGENVYMEPYFGEVN